jgi:hypothetical protein
MLMANEARKLVEKYNEEVKNQNKTKAYEVADKIGEEIQKRAEQGFETYTIKVSGVNEEVLKMLNDIIFQSGYIFEREENIFIIKW